MRIQGWCTTYGIRGELAQTERHPDAALRAFQRDASISNGIDLVECMAGEFQKRPFSWRECTSVQSHLPRSDVSDVASLGMPYRPVRSSMNGFFSGT